MTDPLEHKISNLIGFGPLTPISCSFGDVPSHVLRERDMVRTKDGGFQSITKIDRIVLDEEFMKYHPRAHPVLIRAGALGAGLPKDDVMLAPYQTLQGSVSMAGSGTIRAIDLLGRPNVHRKTEPMITYTRFQCDQPACVHVLGLWVDIGGRRTPE